MGIFVFEAACAIQRRGHQVKVIAMHSQGAKVLDNWEGVEIIRTKYLPETWEMLQSQGGGLPEVWKNKPWARLQLVPFLFTHFYNSLVFTRDCDLLHANWTLSGAIAMCIHWISRKPYLVTVQGSDIFKAARNPLFAGVTRIVLNGAKKVVALSNSLAREIDKLRVDPSLVEIIPNGVDTHRFTSLPFEQRLDQILFVGSLIDRKGVGNLLQAFASVIKHFPGLHLILAGEGSQCAEYKALACSLGISEEVVFTGSQTQEQVAEHMRKSKLFVLPSIEEGLGVVLLEALASGTPIVASNVGGIPDVVTETVGKLVSPGDLDGLDRAISAILSLSVDKWNILHENARLRAVEIFDWDQIALRICQLYQG